MLSKLHGMSTRSESLYILTVLILRPPCRSVRGLKSQLQREYLPELRRVRAVREQTLQAAKDDSMNRLMKDLTVDQANHPDAAQNDRWDDEGEDEDEHDEDDNIIDRSAFLLSPAVWAGLLFASLFFLILPLVVASSTLVGCPVDLCGPSSWLVILIPAVEISPSMILISMLSTAPDHVNFQVKIICQGSTLI